MSHPDPAILALLALGEPAGTSHDDDHVADCADCQSELEQLTRVVDLARQDGPLPLEQPPPAVWEQIAAAVAEDTQTAPPSVSSAGGVWGVGSKRARPSAVATRPRHGSAPQPVTMPSESRMSLQPHGMP